MTPDYDLDKIKFATDEPTFEKAVGLYESGKVTKFEDNGYTYTATVFGGQVYKVFVSNKKYDMGGCECYLGQNDTLCKHMAAVAIYAVMGGEKLTDEDKKLVSSPACSGSKGTLSNKELTDAKKEITGAMKCIKPYNGPSRIWFAYQNSLSEGCRRLSKIISGLPVSGQTAGLLVGLLIRLDDKLCQGGVDDSNGTVGGFIEEVVSALKEYARLDPSCIGAFDKLKNKETCFGWEEPLFVEGDL